jgi:L-aminoadipate-semialdehyde dehydrogenase
MVAVQGTMEALKLCLQGQVIKPFHFVSSTSVLDTPAYTETKATSILESDDLEGSRVGLTSGYGQSKWVAEKLLMQAQALGLPVTIIRPGYIVGDAQTGVTNTDDFLWRLCKGIVAELASILFAGCIELGRMPIMHNVVNSTIIY